MSLIRAAAGVVLLLAGCASPPSSAPTFLQQYGGTLPTKAPADTASIPCRSAFAIGREWLYRAYLMDGALDSHAWVAGVSLESITLSAMAVVLNPKTRKYELSGDFVFSLTLSCTEERFELREMWSNRWGQLMLKSGHLFDLGRTSPYQIVYIYRPEHVPFAQPRELTYSCTQSFAANGLTAVCKTGDVVHLDADQLVPDIGNTEPMEVLNEVAFAPSTLTVTVNLKDGLQSLMFTTAYGVQGVRAQFPLDGVSPVSQSR